jgi:type IV pilus assembly protein PilQ
MPDYLRKLEFIAIGILLLLILPQRVSAHVETDSLRTVMDSLAVQQIPALNAEVDISVNRVRVDEFLRALANDVGLNLSIPSGQEIYVSNNFSKVKAKDVLLFLCNEYHLDMDVMGTIIKLYRPQVQPTPPPPLAITYNEEKKVLSYDLKGALLGEVAREITRKSQHNLILAPGLEGQNVSGFVEGMDIYKALQQLAYSNNLRVKKEDERLYVMEHRLSKSNRGANQRGSHGLSPVPNLKLQAGTQIQVTGMDSISIDVDNYPVAQIFPYVAQKLKQKYTMLNPLKGNVNLHLRNVGWEQFLYHLFKGGGSTYKFQNRVCFVGDRSNVGLKTVSLLPLQFRSVEKLKENFPVELIRGVDVKEFAELNSLVVMGDADRIYEFGLFLKEVDRMVPVVLIDVMIVEVSDTRELETGIEAGLGKEPSTTQGSINPGVDMTLNSSSVNNMIKDLGLTKLGQVTPNFYMKIKALESKGVIDVRSTPRLSTLNGHEATLTIGKTEYYKEEMSNLYGIQNPQLSTQTLYKPVEAELKVTIKPYVAGDGNVTLEIDVDQSDFTERISKFAPPGKVSRKFKSMIRVDNQEMILLGGLEEKSKRRTTKGFPLLSRIPILKWFFSSQSRQNSKSKLNILIKPTVIG